MQRKFANQFRRSRNAYPSRGGCLTNTQKAAICILAREAFAVRRERTLQREAASEASRSREAGGSVLVKTEDQSFSDWRREQQLEAVGKESLRDCVQGDYKKLLAHFLNLKGETGRAVKNFMEDATEDREIALRKLENECAARGLTLSYPAAICKSKFKCSIEQATARMLWVLFFDVKTSKHPRLTAEVTEGDPF